MKRGIYTKIGFFWNTEKENEWECQIGDYHFLLIEKEFNFRCTVFYDSVFVFSEDSHSLTLAKNRCRNQYEKHKRTLLNKKANSLT